MNVCLYVCLYVCMYACMYVCTYVHMYICTYVYMYVYIYIYIYIHINIYLWVQTIKLPIHVIITEYLVTGPHLITLSFIYLGTLTLCIIQQDNPFLACSHETAATSTIAGVSVRASSIYNLVAVTVAYDKPSCPSTQKHRSRTTES